MRQSRRRALLLACAGLAIAVGVPVGTAMATTKSAPQVQAAAPFWATQLQFDNNGQPWSSASFAALKAKGLNSAEIDLPWNTLEPRNGTFSFTELDQELANAAAAGITLVPIFWSSGWGGSPAAWVTSREIAANGATSVAPGWWDPNDQPAYVTYVTTTVRHIAGAAGYGGSILDYGFLDAQWDYQGGASGWAQSDIDEFHNVWLAKTYGTIASFNSALHTSYSSFAQVPAARPGETLAGVYQAFRAWSVSDAYGRLAAAVRAIIATTPLYYYFGGHFGNAVTYANIPDIFFELARQYTVTIIVDAAQSPGLALTFGSLARAYGVKLAQEWTAPSDDSQLTAQAVQWVANYGMGLPQGGGEDFFIHDGTTKDTFGWPVYTSWLPTMQGLAGSYPQQNAAVYLDFSAAYGNTAGGNVLAMEDDLSRLWLGYQAGFAVVTSQEVANGTVKLSSYRAVLPLNGVDANVTAYKNAGGTVLTAGSQLASYAPAYVTLANSGVVQVVPTVNGNGAALVIANITSGTAYNASITVSPTGLGLPAGTYHLVTSTGAVPPQSQTSGGVCATLNIGAAQLTKWSVVAGAIPAGTPTCGATTPPPPNCGTVAANQTITSVPSCDGRFTLNMQGDGNLVLYMGGTPLWASNTAGKGATRAVMQGDGNLVLYTSAGSPVWASNTSNNAGAHLSVQNDGNTVIYSTSGAALWATNTSGH